VLLRTNALVNQFTEFLSAYGLPVAHLARPRYPRDWSLCRLLVQLMSQPDNDYLAFEWLNITQGISTARVARSASLEHRTTINRSYLKLPPFSVAALMSVADANQISQESQELALDLLNRTDPSNLDLELSRLPEFQPVGWGVNVLTMHAAKGKEWSTVILPSFEQCFIPGRRKDLDVDSERRLAFVAVTRAKHTLLISHCTERKLEWMPEPIESKPSQFIAEMGL
jgi:superfamily I DNA/RNA helicase